MYRLNHLTKAGKVGILCFLVSLSIGYFTGLLFVNTTTSLSPTGIEENYNGNISEDENEFDFNQELKYKKPLREIITIIHEHIISFSLIFFCTGLLLYFCEFNPRLKWFLLIEPFVSTVITFGGIYLLWLELTWVKYIIMISGFLITTSYIFQISFIVRELFFIQQEG